MIIFLYFFSIRAKTLYFFSIFSLWDFLYKLRGLSGWDERCIYLLNRSITKWKSRTNNKDPIIPKYPSQEEIDLKYLPGNFITLIKLFSSKCKYCGSYRVTPTHLKLFHKIEITDFSIQEVYELWKSKKLYGERNQRKEQILSLKVRSASMSS